MTTFEFERLAAAIVDRNADNLINDGADVQIKRAVEQLEKFNQHTPLIPVIGADIDLAGFGVAPVYFTSGEHQYVLLSETASALGMPSWTACKWARQEYLFTVEQQRDLDEERGDGRLGWECMRGYLDLHLDFIADDPDGKIKGYDGRTCSSYGDWLISNDRLPLLLLLSPWGTEFMNNIHDHMSIGTRKVFGDQLCDLTAYGADGNPTETRLFHTDLTEEEALRKARRGLVIGDEEDS